MAARADVLKLYKSLIKEARNFPSYNFRMYTLRRIRSRFRENKSLTDLARIEFHLNEGKRNLEIVKRQVIINNLYQSNKLVIEKEC